MISYEDFVRRAAESFAFLEDEFGFRRVAENSQAPEAWLKYESDDRRVIVHFEAGSGTWVELAELERSGPNSVILRRDFNLERLLKRRGLPVPSDSLPTAERVAAFAESLRRSFENFLRGQPI